MHLATWIVLMVATVTTIGLVYYVRAYLPHELERRYRESIRAFCVAIELRFPSHKGLTTRVTTLSAAVAERMDLPQRRRIELDMAAQLRDIGLCSVPYNLVNGKSPDRWTEAERFVYERHAEVSGAMLELVPHLRHLAPIVRNHHVEFRSQEPVSGVLRSRVPIESYILNAVTSYVWNERWQGSLLAKDDLIRGKGVFYEPNVIDALLEVLPCVRVAEPERALAI